MKSADQVERAESVAVEDRGTWGVIELRRPQVRNAFDAKLIAELTAAARLAQTKSSWRLVVLRGAGKSFCAGADLAYMQGMAGFSYDDNLADARRLEELFWELRSLPMPLVARVHGHAMGGGVGLLSVCDLVAAEESAEFCFSEVRLGLAPAVISPYVLERTSGRAARWMWTGEVFSARQARDMGLVDDIISNDESQFTKLIERLLQNGPSAMRATKALLRQQSCHLKAAERPRLVEMTTAAIARLRVAPEGQEGIRAFLNKSEPNWRKGQP